MHIEAIATKAGDLQPGDLFSTRGPLYWELRDLAAIGEKVYIRTDAPCPADQIEMQIFRIVVHHA